MDYVKEKWEVCFRVNLSFRFRELHNFDIILNNRKQEKNTKFLRKAMIQFSLGSFGKLGDFEGEC